MKGPDLNLQIGELLSASRNEEILQCMENLYLDLDNETANSPGYCRLSSACCQFGRYDHSVYVTALEVCYYLAKRAPLSVIDDTCPHLIDGLCGIRDNRPMGCRVFLCDTLAADWQAPLMERYLARIKKLHVQFGVGYFYLDWMIVLKAIQSYELSEKNRLLDG